MRRTRGGRRRPHDGTPPSEHVATPAVSADQLPEITDEAVAASAFARFGLRAESLRAVIAAGYTQPSPIQDRMIPPALAGHDVIGLAQTGTGKTAAFVLPLLERLDETRPDTQALVVTPTRELALQVEQEARKLALFRPRLTTLQIYGGQALRAQIKLLEAGAHLCVGTPGRILDHLQRRTLNPKTIEYVVLDEVDRMFDLGFRDDVRTLLQRCRERRQTIVCSATLDAEARGLVLRNIRPPVEVSVVPRQLMVRECDQAYCTVLPEQRLTALLALLAAERVRIELMLIFCRTKRGADRLHDRVNREGHSAGVIHGDLPQRKREHALQRFRDGVTPILIATDVAARGLDIPNVSHIVNYDIPQGAEDYVHRIGRTARMGARGRAFTFVTQEEGPLLTEIEKLINEMIPHYEIPNYSPAAPAAPAGGGDRSPDGAPVRPPPAAFPNRRRRRYRPF